MVTLSINGKQVQVPEETTVLRAAQRLGIEIPTLCDHPDLHPLGGCRLCLVEVKGGKQFNASCALPVSEGMEVTTESPALAEARRDVLKLMLHGYHDAGYANGQSAPTELVHWATHYGLDVAEHQAKEAHYPINADPNPVVWVDMNKCIQCGRCIRACAEVQGRFVWQMTGRGFDSHPIAGVNNLMLDARCESCGACVAYCPTGALDNKPSMGAGLPEKKVTTTCGYCGVGCQFDLNVKDNQVIRVTSNPQAPVNGMHLCVKGRYGYDYIHHPERLTKPRVRRYLLEAGDTPKPSAPQQNPTPLWDWVETDWDTALGITSRKLQSIRDSYGAESIGILTSAKCTNEENYLMNKLARQVIGTNSIDHCARL
jgi:formate dehydrogenase major subunit/formate dehydrogenase alpha subunit